VVNISLTQGNTTVVSSGLNPGDTVVTDGQDKLQTGSKIEPRNPTPANSSTGSNPGVSGSPNSGTPNSGTPAS
jgi:multidrug efflux system membrane fusion protein